MDAMFTSECFISPSQEDVLSRIPEWRLEVRQHRSLSSQPTDNYSEDAEEEEEESSYPQRLRPALGTKRTIICSAPDSDDFSDQHNTQASGGSQEEEEEEEKEMNVRNAATDSFDYKFESDRDQSPITQSQTIRIDLNVSCDLETETPQQTAAHSAKRISVSASSSRPPNHNQVTPKPPSCRRFVMPPSDSGSCKSVTIPPAKTPPILTVDGPTPAIQHVPQQGQVGDTGGIDIQPSAAELEKGHAGANDKAEREVASKDGARERRIQRRLPSSLKPRTSTSTVRFEEEPERRKEDGPKRQRMNPKPFPETLMDVIVYYSGEPPSRSEDVDIVEVAMNAGMTFPPPISRNRFRG